MASVFPGSLDSFPTSHVDNVNEIIHASTVNDLADATNKIEAALGTNPQGGSADVKTRFTNIESLIGGSSGGLGSGQIVYVAPPTGVAATDTAAIQAAHDSLPSVGGIVQLCRGSYAISPSSPLVFSKAILLRGHGRVPPRAGVSQGYSTTAPTMLTFDSATATCISCTATDTFGIHDLGIVNTHSTAPTAGAGISVTGVLVSGFEIIGVSAVGFYRNIDIQQGSEWLVQRCYIGDFVEAGIRVQNLTNADYGDGEISSSYIYRGPSYLGANHGIDWHSGGGLRVQGNKFNIDGTPGADGSIAVYLNTAASVVTSDLLIEGNSIENYDYGIATVFTPGGGSTVGNIVVVGNQLLTNTVCIDFNTTSTGFFKNIRIGDNVLVGSASGLILNNIDNINYGGNVYDASLTTKLSVGSGVTNSLGDSGREIGYTQITTDANITDTVIGTATALISPGVLTFDGGAVMVEFYGLIVADTANATDLVTVTLYEGASLITQLGFIRAIATAAPYAAATTMRYRFTPTAGSHTYKLCAFVPSTTGTPRITAGTGSGNAEPPAFLRFTKV